MNTARQQNTHPNEAQVAARLAQCPWREADYNSRITGSTHSVIQDGNVFRCGCLRSKTLSGLLHLIDKTVK